VVSPNTSTDWGESPSGPERTREGQSYRDGYGVVHARIGVDNDFDGIAHGLNLVSYNSTELVKAVKVSREVYRG